ncbi:MAG: aminodeoxychorismate/anthranilate synthase component II [Thiohalorhabdaceae bacterium]
MPILMIDNYDSFTYNLVQYLGELGAEVTVYRNDALDVADIAGLDPAGIVLSPGPCGPDEAGISIDTVRAYAGRIPLLGVCLGHQAIAAAYGGDVVRAPAVMHGKTSEVLHDNAGVFAGLPNPFEATRYHSLIVERASVPAELAITAWTEDDTIMGLRYREMDVEGVQFHPESILTGSGKDLLANFLARTGRHEPAPA